MTGNLLIHQAHTIKVNAVKDEQAHFGVLEGSFLQRNMDNVIMHTRQLKSLYCWNTQLSNVPCALPAFQRGGVCWCWYRWAGLQHLKSYCGLQQRLVGCILWNVQPEKEQHLVPVYFINVYSWPCCTTVFRLLLLDHLSFIPWSISKHSKSKSKSYSKRAFLLTLCGSTGLRLRLK